MAFQNRNLNVLAYANGLTMWHYKTTDVVEELLDGYFNPVATLMNQNDMLVINTGDQNCIMFVKEINNGNVKLG